MCKSVVYSYEWLILFCKFKTVPDVHNANMHIFHSFELRKENKSLMTINYTFAHFFKLLIYLLLWILAKVGISKLVETEISKFK